MQHINETQWIRDTAIKRLGEAVSDITQIRDLTPKELRAMEVERDALSRVLDKHKALA